MCWTHVAYTCMGFDYFGLCIHVYLLVSLFSCLLSDVLIYVKFRCLQTAHLCEIPMSTNFKNWALPACDLSLSISFGVGNKVLQAK